MTTTDTLPPETPAEAASLAAVATTHLFGIAPYYEDASVVIYHADCREVLPELPMKRFALLATDPPYGMAFGGFRGVEQNVRADGARQGIRMVRRVVFEAMPHMLDDAHFYVFCHWESWPDFYDALSAYISVKSSLIWHKDRGGMGDTEMEYARDYEVILYGATGRRPLMGKRDGAVIKGIAPEGNIKNRVHPTQKPAGLMGYLIEKSCPPGEWVLDPFMGGGSTLVAAKERGRRAVGIELNEAYCEAAAKRCSEIMAMPIHIPNAKHTHR